MKCRCSVLGLTGLTWPYAAQRPVHGWSPRGLPSNVTRRSSMVKWIRARALSTIQTHAQDDRMLQRMESGRVQRMSSVAKSWPNVSGQRWPNTPERPVTPSLLYVRTRLLTTWRAGLARPAFGPQAEPRPLCTVWSDVALESGLASGQVLTL
jgi:hypothetical protein